MAVIATQNRADYGFGIDRHEKQLIRDGKLFINGPSRVVVVTRIRKNGVPQSNHGCAVGSTVKADVHLSVRSLVEKKQAPQISRLLHPVHLLVHRFVQRHDVIVKGGGDVRAIFLTP